VLRDLVPGTESKGNLERFRKKVLGDPALLSQLRAAADEDQFIRLMLQLGAAEGLPFRAEEVLEAIRSSRRSWLERWL
jgi:hypothetical protein